MDTEKTKNGIVYILGAGASANALPLVSEMIDRLKLFYTTIFIYDLYLLKDRDDKEKLKNILLKLKVLISKVDDRRSIDTYAKELHIKNNTSELKDLKSLLASYLVFEEMFSDKSLREFFSDKFSILKNDNFLERVRSQSGVNEKEYLIDEAVLRALNVKIKQDIKQNNQQPEYLSELSSLIYLFRYDKVENKFKNNKSRLDQRYINFLVDLIDSTEQFPTKIKIFSWNYDAQFRAAIKSLGFKLEIKLDEYSFLKRLNGIAGHNQINPVNLDLQTFDEKFYECIMFSWRASYPENERLKFAFEHDTTDNQKSHLESFDNITDVVVIGYSFPLSNRKTDKNVFEALLNKVSYTKEKKINLRIHINVPPTADVDNDTFLITKSKIIDLISLVNPELVISSDELELNSSTTEYGIWSIGSMSTAAYEQRKENYTTHLNIKFFKRWDPNNFYIPQTF